MAVLMITHNEQWLKDYPGTVYRCKDMEMTKVVTEEKQEEQTPIETITEEINKENQE